ncbi:ATP-binding protein [Roseibacterium beibuensis]|uniref:TniB protein n=1 Tax=[Roseibacterium] beibuensis TaxID=1193142 RepID=A0ABP9KQX7_9RHOB|nr:ATP-binding protein [Roseibacterium beibuensis]MCS6622520.1 ATP-binding protein [Roseibacterium beibuensis]
MSFVNEAVVDVRKPLMEARFPFNRAQDLAEAMTMCVTEYYIKASIGGRFEASGILVIGDSRQGKSTEIDAMLRRLNDGSTTMPDGRPARVISCLLSGKVTWKDLGVEILEVLGYPLRGRHSQSEICSKVRKYAELQGVVGIHFDECQHVFTENDSLTNQKFLDSFKSLLKDHQWPLMLIFSGVPSLAAQIQKEEQLYRLLRTVNFSGIDLASTTDKDELLHLIFSYCDKAQLEFDDFELDDFLDRLVFAGCQRWGLVIELLIEALTVTLSANEKICTIDHFAEGFSRRTGLPFGYSPFTMPNYREGFKQHNLLDAYETTRRKKMPRKN